MKNRIGIRDIGCLKYCDAWDLQNDLRAQRCRGEIPDIFLFVEHPRVYTLGKRDCDHDLLAPIAEIEADGIEVIKSNRGGRATYHGPGQLVGYFIFSLQTVQLSVQGFVGAVERLCQRVLKDFGVPSHGDEEHPGVWIGNNKIAAIGLHFSQGVSQHGFALNVKTNLNDYRYIIPCGIRDRGVTSMEHLGVAVSMQEVKASMASHMAEVFQSDVFYDSTAEKVSLSGSSSVSSKSGEGLSGSTSIYSP